MRKNYIILLLLRLCRELCGIISKFQKREKMLSMCGCWYCKIPDHLILIERVKGNLQATYAYFDDGKMADVQVIPIVEVKGKYIIQTAIGDFRINYYPDSDTLKTDIRYKRVTTKMLKLFSL